MTDAHGQVLTVRGPVPPAALGAVMMHEHMHIDMYRWQTDEFITKEEPATPERRAYLLREAVPRLRQLHGFGGHAYVEATPEPWRAWPTLYRELTDETDIHIILCCGFYREVEIGTYWVKRPEDRIWPYVAEASIEELTDHLVGQITQGIHGTAVRAGAIKLGCSQPPMTELELKTFRAGARAQKKTGVHITTHCNRLGAETSQLTILDEEGVDLNRVVIGHTGAHIALPDYRKTILEWMKRGANFLSTNLEIAYLRNRQETSRPVVKWMKRGASFLPRKMGIYHGRQEKKWSPLVEGIHEIFAAGQGDKLVLGLDSGYTSESQNFGPMPYMPPHPFTFLFTDILPAFRAMGLEPGEEKAMLETNPQRILPVQ